MADTMQSAIHTDEKVRTVSGDRGSVGKWGDRFSEDTTDLGENVDDPYMIFGPARRTVCVI
jgi:hypothetical protein